MNRPPLLFYPFIISIGSVAALLFTPGIPDIMHHFQLSSDAVQATVSIFIFGYAISQLIYGPVSNWIGRKRALCLALSIGMLGCLLSALSGPLNSFTLMMLGRFIAAIGTGGGLTLAFTIINDVYSYEESRRILPVATLAFAVLPGVSIFIGGHLTVMFGWESCFYFLFFYCFCALLASLCIPETSDPSKWKPLQLTQILNQYKKVGSNPTLLLYASIWGFCTSVVYVFSSAAPMIAIDHMGNSPEVFGTYNLLLAGGMVGGTFFTRYLAKRYAAENVMILGVSILLTAVLVLLYFVEHTMLDINTLFLPMTVYYFGLTAVFTNASALAIRTATDKGTASSLISFTNMFLAVVFLFISSLFEKDIEHIMPEIFLVAVLLIMSFMIIARKQPYEPI